MFFLPKVHEFVTEGNGFMYADRIKIISVVHVETIPKNQLNTVLERDTCHLTSGAQVTSTEMHSVLRHSLVSEYSLRGRLF